ncbi:MAG: 3-deoxy-manno-octulosonate cytidylyltransferase [Pseudomonadales bacterium]|nr:3-deoxy-manno-octulosonate cytidylyltransferase [Pseudomonadales bacterium]
MSYKVVIPARHASTRLPGKPLLELAGLPMVLRVWERARQSAAEEVVVATDDARIAEVVRAHGGDAEMTAADHPSGTDRLAEVAALRGWNDEVLVVNVQGDEPLIPPAVIDQVAGDLAACPAASMATLAEPLASIDALNDPNVVKVVRDAQGLALYFSRAPVPWPRDGMPGTPSGGPWRRHIGIYAYRVGLLRRFVTWPPAVLEGVEMLEQLRVLDAGERIHVADACAPVPGGVDTQADLDRIRTLMEEGT